MGGQESGGGKEEDGVQALAVQLVGERGEGGRGMQYWRYSWGGGERGGRMLWAMGSTNACNCCAALVQFWLSHTSWAGSLPYISPLHNTHPLTHPPTHLPTPTPQV